MRHPATSKFEKNIKQWCLANGWSLNGNKTILVNFKNPPKNGMSINKKLVINGEVIAIVNQTKFLEIAIDGSSSFRSLIIIIFSKRKT